MPRTRHPTRAAAALGLIAAALGAALVGHATPVGGRLGTGRANAPSLRVYAYSRTTGRLYSLAGGTATTWSLDLPAGRYWLFAGLDGPGAPPIYAAYTEFSRCAPGAGGAVRCDSHELVELTVAGRRLEHVDLTDWALSDAGANAIDTVLGRAAVDPYDESGRAAPKFSEYPARAAALSGQLAREPAGARDADREPLLATWAEPPNYAGRFRLAPVACAEGTGCGGVALVDPATGSVRYPGALNPLPEPPPCETHAVLQYRRDSRLLIVRAAGTRGSAALHYYVVDPASGELKPVASRAASDLPAHCAGAPLARR